MEKIIAQDISKVYCIDDRDFYAINDLNLEIKKGEIVVVLGPSGSGKTTLLNVLSGLDTVSVGNVFYDKENIAKYSDRKLTAHRRLKSSFVFQNYNLLENLTVYQNVMIGSEIASEKTDIDEIISVVGLKNHIKKKPHQLSGGEQQRVSLARALAKNPEVLFCDEPTGALDEKTGKNVLEKLIKVNEKYNTTMIIVTHNPSIALIGDRIIKMNSGRIVSDEPNKRVKPTDISWGWKKRKKSVFFNHNLVLKFH